MVLGPTFHSRAAAGHAVYGSVTSTFPLRASDAKVTPGDDEAQACAYAGS